MMNTIKIMASVYLIHLLALIQSILKKLNQDRFVQMCYDTIKNDFDNLDSSIQWHPSHGVSPNMLFEICKKLKISHYSFDVSNKCFLKYVSTSSQNYPALVYYAINDHMYHIKNKDEVRSLVSQTLVMEHKIVSSVFTNEEEKTNIFTKYQMQENTPIEEILEIAKSLKKDSGLVIMYTKTDNLETEFEKIISLYKVIPVIRNKKAKIVRIKPFKNIHLYLVIDPNYSDVSLCDYKKVQELCLIFNVEFKNQTLNGLISEVKSNFYDPVEKRHKFTPSEREELYEKSSKKCAQCDKEVKNIKSFHLDHIQALANGGTNELNNIQILCIACHIDKTNCENEKGYVKLSSTESSFNNETRNIFSSNQYGSYAFVDNFIDDLKDGVDISKIYSLDINKCRRNIILHNNEDYPVFTVLDKVEKYVESKELKTGVYFVETNNYFPLRGNRWYHLPIVKYCLRKNIIKHADIKYQVIAGVKLKADYFNKFIEFISKKLVNDKDMLKFAVNGMIGKFKPKPTENWTSLCVQENPNDVFYHFLQQDGCFIKNRTINDKTYYHAYKKFISEKDESESPIYHQILELEAIELYKLSKIIKSKNGTILDLNTDAISFVTENNELPFKLSSDGVNIKGFYFNGKKELPKYKLEDKKGRLSIPK